MRKRRTSLNFARTLLLLSLFSCCSSSSIEPLISVSPSFCKSKGQRTLAFIGVFKRTGERLNSLGWERFGSRICAVLRERGFLIVTRSPKEMDAILKSLDRDQGDVFSVNARPKIGKLLGARYLLMGKSQYLYSRSVITWHTLIRIVEAQTGKVMVEMVISSASECPESAVEGYVEARKRALVTFAKKMGEKK